MNIIRTAKDRIRDLERENADLRARLAQEHEKVQFLGLLAADVDLEELTEEVPDDGE